MKKGRKSEFIIRVKQFANLTNLFRRKKLAFLTNFFDDSNLL